MNRFKLVWVVASVLAMLLGANQWWQSEHAAKAATTSADHGIVERETSSLAAQLEELRGQVGSIAAGQALLATNVQGIAKRGSAAQEPAFSSRVTDDPESAEARDERAQNAAQRQIETIEAQIAEEPVDGEWSKLAAKDLRDKIDVRGAVVSDVKCASTMCRFSLSTKTPQHTTDGIDEVLNQRPWNGEAFFYIDHSEPTKANVFLARTGAALPRVQ
jgi:hypothetical protein